MMKFSFDATVGRWNLAIIKDEWRLLLMNPATDW